MWVTGMPGGGPVRAGIAVADVGAGLHCAIGILIALLEREVSGQGQWVSSSLLQAMISMCDFQAARWTIAKDVPGQAGNNHPTAIPTGVFKTKRRLHQHRGVRRPHLQALLREHQGAGAADRRAVLVRQGARQAPRRAERGDRQADGAFSSAEAGREAEQGGRAGRADLQDGRDVRRSAGQAPEDGASRSSIPSSATIELIGQAINMSRTPFEMRRRRRSRASTPMRC